MERPNFFNEQYVLSDDLNNIHHTLGSQSVYRTQAVLGNSGGVYQSKTFYTGSVHKGGIFGSPADYTNTGVNFYPTLDSSTQITIASGSALDVNGQFIRLTSTKTMSMGSSDTNYVWTASASSLNYIKLKYIEATGSIKADDSGNTYPTRYTGSYYFTVDSTVPASTELLLGTFTGGASGQISGTIQDRRQYVRIVTPANAVILDPDVKPVSTWNTVEDHIRAVGTGTASATNPHGMTLADLNYNDSVVGHRIDSHVNGIILNQRTAAALISYSGSVVSAASNAQLAFSAPVAATASINGTLFSGSVSSIFSSSAPSDGVFWVVLNASGTPSFVSTSSLPYDDSSPHLFPQYMRLGRATIADSKDDITLWEDFRDLYVMSPYDVRADFTEATTSPTGSVAANLARTSTLVTNMNRIRGAIGTVISGSVQAWSGSVPISLYQLSVHDHSGDAGDAPKMATSGSVWWTGASASVTSANLNTLTSGSYNDAGALHSHKPADLVGVSANVTATNLNTLTAGSTSDAISLHRHDKQVVFPVGVVGVYGGCVVLYQ